MAARKSSGDMLRAELVDGMASAARSAGFTFEWDAHELLLIDQAAKVADQISALEALIASGGLVVAGSTGQDRLHPAVTELRQHRALLGSLLGRLKVPDWEDNGQVKSWRHQKAAESRWAR